MKLILKNILLPLAGFNLELELEMRGRITAIFGPSGAGKTSLLELVAGLRRATSAFIQLDECVLSDTAQGVSVPTWQRGIGYVPQDLALFPHLTVRQNVLYGQKAGARAGQMFTLEHVAGVLEIQTLLPRAVGELSGGEKQRVALARALLAAPRLLLLDEPLASLDQKLKARIIPCLARIRDEFQIPMLYVTHDRREITALADELVVLAEGRIAQSGSVQEVFNHPASLTVAGMLTVETILPGRVVQQTDELVTVAVGSARLTAVAEPFAIGGEVHVCIRAEDVILLKGSSGASSARNQLPAVVHSVTSEGRLMRVELDGSFPLTALLTRQACEEMMIKPGDQMTALVKAQHIHLLSR